ncbi:LytTR family transcriptional regulator [Lacihabitans sp. CS3-21]|nr:LytTR family transcriptional regulator [Lacihabitans sp. CS3-21]
MDNNDAMKTPKILKNLSQESICYLESSINYTLFFLKDGRSMVSGYNIKVYEALFEDMDFIKVNRSKLINVAFIKKTLCVDNTYSVILQNGDEINIARRRVNKIRDLYPMMF